MKNILTARKGIMKYLNMAKLIASSHDSFVFYRTRGLSYLDLRKI